MTSQGATVREIVEQLRREFNGPFGVHWSLLSTSFTGMQFWQRSRHGIWPKPGETVLEVACGSGNILVPLARRVPEARFIGVDIAEQMVRLGQKRAKRWKLTNVTFTVGDMTALDLGDASVDKVIISRVLGHYADLTPVFAELSRVLKPGGIGIIINEVRVSGFDWYKYLLLAWLGVLVNPTRKAFIFDYIRLTPTIDALVASAERAGMPAVEILRDGYLVCLITQKTTGKPA